MLKGIFRIYHCKVCGQEMRWGGEHKQRGVHKSGFVQRFAGKMQSPKWRHRRALKAVLTRRANHRQLTLPELRRVAKYAEKLAVLIA